MFEVILAFWAAIAGGSVFVIALLLDKIVRIAERNEQKEVAYEQDDINVDLKKRNYIGKRD